jgi:hypothetical protein
MNEWLTYKDGTFDVRDVFGQRIDRVRAVRVEDGGVRVIILGTVEGGRLAAFAGDHVLIHFEGFVPGGTIVRTGRIQ